MHGTAFPLIFIAEAATPIPLPGWEFLIINYGIAGVMLGWFMWRVERRMDKQNEANHRIAKAIELSTRGQMVAIAALKSIEKLGLRDLAGGLIEEIDSAQAHRDENIDR